MKSSDFDDLLAASVSRRNFLRGVGALAGMIVVARYADGAFAQTKYDKSPFSLGVASGDPLPDGIVLWTRLAPAPFDGGGMPRQDVPVRWWLASDASMKSIVQKGTAMATAALGHSVHIEVEGLKPAHHYWYQFESGGALSPIGRTRTAPALSSHPKELRFAFASCQQWQVGYYTAYRHMAQQDLDFAVHLGDYIYEGAIRNGSGNVRPDILPARVLDEPMTLEQYRMRYSLYKLDPDLQAAHAAFPFIVTWDDHEVENNYAGAIDEHNDDPAAFLVRRAAAYQAYYEHMPLRRTSLPHGADAMLYRRLTFGDLAQFNVLDTRQYRSDQPNNDGFKGRNAANLDPKLTLMGAPQRQWLFDGMDRSPARWNVIAQQIVMAQFARKVTAGDTFNMDAWDGYPAERARLMNFLEQRKPRNPVVIAGDSHTNLVGDLKTDFDKSESPIVGSEFAGTAITSGGLTEERNAAYKADAALQPHLKWFEGTKRGYVSCTLDRKTWKSDFIQIDTVKEPNSAVMIGSSWVIEDGKLGVQRA